MPLRAPLPAPAAPPADDGAGHGATPRAEADDAWRFDAVADRLRSRLGPTEAAPGTLPAALPGHDAHLTMAPSHRLDRFLLSVEGKKAREAATLVLVYPDAAGRATLLLTVRPATLRDHAGQVAFPGGRREEGESAAETALREAWEEVGLDAGAVEIVGAMTPLYVPPTRFSVYPIVALATTAPALAPAPDEVAHLLPVALGDLFDGGNRGVGTWETVHGLSDVPYYRAVDATGAEHRVWGATAMMLAELHALAAP